jgi:hypothetical protein
MPQHDENSAKELLLRHSVSAPVTPEDLRARTHMWVAVSVCSVVVIGMFALVATKTYDFVAVRDSILGGVKEVQAFTEQVKPVTEQSQAAWDVMQANLKAEASKQVEANVVNEMKKQLDTPEPKK